MICKVCGTENSDQVIFCAHCNAILQPDISADESSYGSRDFTPDFRTEEEKNQVLTFQDPNYIPPADSIPVTIIQQKQKRRSFRSENRPSLVLRLPLQLLSFALCMVLTVSLLGTALLLDVNRLVSAGGIKQLVNAFFTTSHNAPVRPATGALGVGMNSEMTDIQIPDDIFTDGDSDALVDWICQIANEATGGTAQIDRDRVTEFVQNSTLTDYIAEKVAGYTSDFIQDTQNTEITAEELKALFEENKELLEETFQVEFTPEMEESIDEAIEKTVVENDLNETIHQQVFKAIEEAIETADTDVTVADARSYLQFLTSKGLVWGSVGLCVILMALLCAANFYNLPGGLTWSSVSCILSGVILSVPIALLQSSPALLTDVLGIPGVITHLLTSFLSVFGPVHYGILILGVALLLLSIAWRVIRAATLPMDEV